MKILKDLLKILFIISAIILMRSNLYSKEKPLLVYDGLWEESYVSNFEDSPLKQEWRVLNGVSLDRLNDLKGTVINWKYSNKVLTGESLQASAIRFERQLKEDVEIHIKLKHPIKDRNFALSLGHDSFDKGYVIIFQRNEIVFTRGGLDNVIGLYPIKDIDSRNESVITITREGIQIALKVNGKEVFRFSDYLPVFSSRHNKFFIAVMESLIAVKEIKINEKERINVKGPMEYLVWAFKNRYFMVYIDYYMKFFSELSASKRKSADFMLMQAAYNIGNFELINKIISKKQNISDDISKLYNFIYMFEKFDAKHMSLAEKNMMPDKQILRENLFIFMISKYNSATSDNDEYFKLLEYFIPSDSFILNRLHLRKAFQYANMAQKDQSYKVLDNLFSKYDTESRFIKKIIISWVDVAKRFGDHETFKKLLNIAETKIKDRNLSAWLLLKKGEWLVMKDDIVDGRTIFKKLVSDYSDQLNPWLWANYNLAKLDAETEKLKTKYSRLKNISEKYPFYKKQSSMLSALLRIYESPQKRRERWEKIKKKRGIDTVKVNSQETGLDGAYALVDGLLDTRWGSEHKNGPYYIIINFKKKTVLNGIKIFWEHAAAKEYDIFTTKDKNIWKKNISITDGKPNDISFFQLNEPEVYGIKILLKQRVTQWGYSIWEILWY